MGNYFIRVERRVYIVGNASKLLPIDSPYSVDELKKNPIEKYFFIMEKNDFENFGFQKKLKILMFSIEK